MEDRGQKPLMHKMRGYDTIIMRFVNAYKIHFCMDKSVANLFIEKSSASEANVIQFAELSIENCITLLDSNSTTWKKDNLASCQETLVWW